MHMLSERLQVLVDPERRADLRTKLPLEAPLSGGRTAWGTVGRALGVAWERRGNMIPDGRNVARWAKC
jgi:hypothetical protein